MPELIFITRSAVLGFGDTVIDEEGTFTVHYARIRSQIGLDRLLGGEVFAELNKHEILEHGEIIPPDGVPPDAFEIGHPAIASFEEALHVAKAAKANPKSILHKLKFPKEVPIYLLKKGQIAIECE